jgi:hypothetical protein
MVYEKVVPASQEDAGTLADRRRPGRIDYQNPHLVGLLRDSDRVPPPAEPVEELAEAAFDDETVDHDDPLGPARGILLGMVIASGMWIVGGFAVWYLF